MMRAVVDAQMAPAIVANASVSAAAGPAAANNGAFLLPSYGRCSSYYVDTYSDRVPYPRITLAPSSESWPLSANESC